MAGGASAVPPSRPVTWWQDGFMAAWQETVERKRNIWLWWSDVIILRLVGGKTWLGRVPIDTLGQGGSRRRDVAGNI